MNGRILLFALVLLGNSVFPSNSKIISPRKNPLAHPLSFHIPGLMVTTYLFSIPLLTNPSVLLKSFWLYYFHNMTLDNFETCPNYYIDCLDETKNLDPSDVFSSLSNLPVSCSLPSLSVLLPPKFT